MYRSTQPTATCSAKLEKSFMVVTSTSQSTRMYLGRRRGVVDDEGKKTKQVVGYLESRMAFKTYTEKNALSVDII